MVIEVRGHKVRAKQKIVNLSRRNRFYHIISKTLFLFTITFPIGYILLLFTSTGLNKGNNLRSPMNIGRPIYENN